MPYISPKSNSCKPRGRPPKARSQRQEWLESILPGRYKGYDIIRRYGLLEESLTDEEFSARVQQALANYQEKNQKYTRKGYRKPEE